MPPVDAAALKQIRYDRQRMNVISRAMDKVANVVSCFPSTSNIAVSSGVSTVRVDVHNEDWKQINDRVRFTVELIQTAISCM